MHQFSIEPPDVVLSCWCRLLLILSSSSPPTTAKIYFHPARCKRPPHQCILGHAGVRTAAHMLFRAEPSPQHFYGRLLKVPLARGDVA
ncbi:hypothetical protein B0H14DRAFT_3039011 [Mycena olivaceomarginata]|nr:hypothetical protein B0H14DRAFT_3039011 [Mycena olivaceomarginata]